MVEDTRPPLEEICKYSEICAESNYGSLDGCMTDYENCKQYKRFEREKPQKRYENEN